MEKFCTDSYLYMASYKQKSCFNPVSLSCHPPTLCSWSLITSAGRRKISSVRMAFIHSCYHPAWLKSVHLGEQSHWDAQERGWAGEVERWSPGANPKQKHKSSKARELQMVAVKRAAQKGRLDLERKVTSLELHLQAGQILISVKSFCQHVYSHSQPPINECSFYSVTHKSLMKIPSTTQNRREPFDTNFQLSSYSLKIILFPTNCIPKGLDLLLSSFSRCVKIVYNKHFVEM